jgi:superfamily II DNA helicase RecQ
MPLAAFRQCFFRLGEVRSLLPLGMPVLALTAAATPKVKKATMEGLSLKPDTDFISVTPNRPNIYLYR